MQSICSRVQLTSPYNYPLNPEVYVMPENCLRSENQLIFKLFSPLPKLWDKVIENFVSNSFACLYFGVCLYQAGEMINGQSEYVVVGKNIFWYSTSSLELVCLDLHVRLPISTLSCTDDFPPVYNTSL